MANFTPVRPDFLDAVRDLHDRMPFVKQLGIVLDLIEPGRVAGKLARRLELTQQHDALHAGVVIGLADQLAGLAAYSLMREGREIVSVDFSVQLLRPADAQVIYAEGWVIKPGERFIFTAARVFGETDGQFKDFANAQITMAVL